jgi:hypothetical protein
MLATVEHQYAIARHPAAGWRDVSTSHVRRTPYNHLLVIAMLKSDEVTG